MSFLALLAAVSVLVAVVSLALLGRSAVRHREIRERTQVPKPYLDELFESSDEPVALVGEDGGILRSNEAFHHLFGHAPSQLEGTPLTELLESRGEGPAVEDVARRAVEGEPVQFEARGRKAGGTELDLSIMGGAVRMPGEDARAFFLFRDLTRRILVEAAFRRLEKALDTMQLGVTITDLEGRIVYTNPADAAMHGYSPEELAGRNVRIFAPWETRDRMTPDELAEATTWRRESINVRKDGSTFPCQLMSDVVRDPGGRPIGVVTTCEDITQRKIAERALEESEERYALALRGTRDGLWDWNLQSGEVFYSSRWKEMLGLEDREVPHTLESWLERVHPEDREDLRFDLAAHRADRTERFENEHRIRHRDGSYRWVLARGMAERDPEGRPYRIAGALTDITERKGAEAQLAQDAFYDPLTGLPNRAFLDDLLRRSFRQAQRQKEYTFAVLFLDLDRFKQVNDTLGHAAGDDLLVEVAERLAQSVRPGDVVTRLAGDEFCVLVDDIRDSRDATRVARRILDRLQKPVHLDGRTVFTGGSIGIAVSEPRLDDPHDLLKNADRAMYRAKTAGGHRFEVFDRSMHEKAVTLLLLEEDLHEALTDGQLRLVYQPVVRLEDKRVIGLEALLRWTHPERGSVPPEVFIPAAEETGVIVPMGWWVLGQACAQMGEWVRRFPSMNGMAVSVNLSAKQLRQPDLVERVEDALERGGLDPARLRLEVSEKTLMEEPEWNRNVLGRLRELGVQVQIDDFLTGTSSLSYLDRFQVASLKIDSSYIQNVDAVPDEAAVVQAIITLARHMDIGVIAEGIETDGQDDRLRMLRCDEGQGFLFSHPLAPDDVDTLLSRELNGSG